jgi:hypothetical protein
MAFSKDPGFVGYEATRVSSFDNRAIGKLTDTNHLQSLHMMEPSDYDKKIITLYTQTAMYNNDFLQMINQSTPYFPDTDYWQWKIGVPYQYPALVALPDSTANLNRPGIDGQEFQIVLDRKAFFIHDVITSDRRYGPNFYITKDPEPYSVGWLYTVTLVTDSPLTDYVDDTWLQLGIQFMHVDTLVGEFDQKLSGLPELGQSITLYESLSAAYGIEHTVTKWADQRTMKDKNGKPLDLMVYTKYRNNEIATPQILDMRWEPFVETQMRKWMMDTKVKRMIWGKPGTAKTGGSQQEVKKAVEGLYWKMRHNGNLVQYPRGEFSINIMRNVFGDLFYRRVDIKDRKVKVYTNEAGIEVFRQAAKKDALNSGLTIIADERFIQGSGQNMTINYAFESVVTMESGKIELVHLKELDEPQTNSEYGQNKKSTPVFLVFDISPEGDGTPKNNVREVRLKGAPSMTWGYVDGRAHHLGFAASQGMSSASMDPGYKIWMEDRADLFVEDLSRTVIIEEIPQY